MELPIAWEWRRYVGEITDYDRRGEADERDQPTRARTAWSSRWRPVRTVTDRTGPAGSLLDEYLTLVDDSCVAVLPHVLRIVAELRVIDELSAGPLPVEKLAAAVDADADALYRLLRALVTVGVLDERDYRTFSLTSSGEPLRSDSPSGSWASLVNGDTQLAWINALDTIRSRRSSFDQAHGGEFFEHKDADAGANRMFLRRMRERARRLYPGFVVAIDWTPSRVVMDIGGGDGYVLERLLEHSGHVTGVLFDRPAVHEVVEESGHLSRFGDRFRRAEGNFFDALPAGADTHLMCSVLHDWTDEQATTILRRSRAALAKGGRLHVVEMILPDGTAWHPAKWSDIGMMVLTGGRERTRAEFTSLLSSAGFTKTSIVDIPGSFFSVITAK